MPRTKPAAPRRAGGAQKTEKAAPKKTAATKAAVKATAKKTVVAKKAAAPTGRAGGAQKAQKAAAPAKKAAPAPKKVASKKAVARKEASPAAVKKAVAKKKHTLDKFELEQKELLGQERARLVAQATELRAEADQLAAEREPGDVQFDEESGEGGTTNIDRERDLALSLQAQQEVEEIDLAMAKLEAGTYGVCEHCGQPIPKARLKAIPHARLCIACKSGGLSRR